MNDQHFTMTDQHIKLLRAMNVGWSADEFGAPCIDPKRPYGNGDVYGDMLRILYGHAPGENATYGAVLVRLFDRLHRETETALQIVLATGVMEPGEYTAPAYTQQWRKVAGL